MPASVTASITASIAACPVDPLSRIIRTERVVTGGGSSPFGIAESLVGSVAALAVPPTASVAVYIGPVTSIFFIGVPGVLWVGFYCARCTFSA